MTEQEQEHMDHVAGSASEFQNSHAVSRMELSAENARVRRLADSFVGSGQFVVMSESTAYCPVTDGITGTHLHIMSAWGERAAAERAVKALYERAGEYCEESYYVLPRLPQPQPECLEPGDDDVPF